MTDAGYAQLVEAAMDGCVTAGHGNLAPSFNLPTGWTLCGHLTALDHLALTDQKVCYGFLVKAPDEYAVVIRGTHGTLEWIEDAEFIPVPHPIEGTVEQGFWGIYETLAYTPLGAQALPVVSGISGVVASGSLTIVGHSLGAAIATYLAFDTAAFVKTRMRLFASPHPGNEDFCLAFDNRLADYVVYDYQSDIVPMIPEGPDYTHLPKRTVLPKSDQIKNSLDCFHTITTYEWLLDSSLGLGASCLLADTRASPPAASIQTAHPPS